MNQAEAIRRTVVALDVPDVEQADLVALLSLIE